MVEWWELIDLIDKNKLKDNKKEWITVLDVKYTNFHFEDNAAWKMMLWIWFVFSKQYSDKLWEDITRWNESKISSWKSLWTPKAGYFINEESYHEPDPIRFPLIKEAFQMKIAWETESVIREYLNSNWYTRHFKKNNQEKPISNTSLNSIFQDDFYYGTFIHWENSVNLKETNKYYVPIITESEFDILQERYFKHPNVNKKWKTNDIFESIRIFDNDFILTEDGYHYIFSLPNRKQRFDPLIEDAWKKWILLQLKDVVKPNQINYKCSHKKSKYKNTSINVEQINAAIEKKLKGFKVSEKDFNLYINYINSQIDWIEKETKEKIESKNKRIGRLVSQKNNYIKLNMRFKEDDDEKAIYEQTKKEYDSKIRFLRKEVEELDDWERNEILEYEMFIDLLSKADQYYKKWDYVQKWKIAKILFLNIKLDPKKRLHIQVKPEFETMFNPVWWSTIIELRTFFENNKEYSISEIYAEKYNDYHEYNWKPIEYYRKKK